MKGWVYIITNPAMPGLLKVGYSTKDPDLRAAELNHTGAPHPYIVEYEILIDDPYAIEQKTHLLLSHRHEAKEWFRCEPEEAVLAIRHVAKDRGLLETFKRLERQKADAAHATKQRARERECQRYKDLAPHWEQIARRDKEGYPDSVRLELARFVGPNADDSEICRCVSAIEPVVGSKFNHADVRKMVVGVRVKMAVGAPRDNIVSMIVTSYPGSVSTRLANSIFDTISEETGYQYWIRAK
jgi:hypothetical protein